MTERIALISGKGGSGKTAVALALGYLAADLDVRTLLVDADLGTHGMTYFFVDQLLAPIRQLSLAGPEMDGQDLVHVNDMLDFLPSVPSIASRTVPEAEDSLRRRVASVIARLEPQYDLVLIDCQAGVTATTTTVLRLSTLGLVVTEADPISIWAVNDLIDELRDSIPGAVRGLVNKAMKEEQGYFEALVDITQRIRYVGQLPFDLDVRRAFFRRDVPIDVGQPSPFLLSLAGVMGRLSDSLQAASARVERWQAEEQLAALTEKRETLLREHETLLRERDSFGMLSAPGFPLRHVMSSSLEFSQLIAYTVLLGLVGGVLYAGDLPGPLAVALGASTMVAAVLVLASLLRIWGYPPRPETNLDSFREIASRIAEAEVAIESLRSRLATGAEESPVEQRELPPNETPQAP